MTKPQKISPCLYEQLLFGFICLYEHVCVCVCVCVCQGVFGNACVGGSIPYPVWVMCFLLCACACVCDETLSPSSPLHTSFSERQIEMSQLLFCCESRLESISHTLLRSVIYLSNCFPLLFWQEWHTGQKAVLINVLDILRITQREDIVAHDNATIHHTGTWYCDTQYCKRSDLWYIMTRARKAWQWKSTLIFTALWNVPSCKCQTTLKQLSSELRRKQNCSTLNYVLKKEGCT